ncbi:ABC transporter ATP-binding protein [Nesterenkonia sp.]|uniref:energy-coupling factor ABC transporter ATP-binding protein n=1 Tax=Nesterenkonia sp. TaxID=704201 RepID=UPI002621F038|nr:ABC transporter ATP-binding protein [Nesterenkonia sp.]
MGSQNSLTIRLENLCLDVDTASGGRRRILHPLTCRITERTVAVVGANGSGKSTLLRLLAGLEVPSGGEVRFDPPQPRVGFIFANPQAQIVMPVVREDVEFSLKQAGVPRAERSPRAQQVLHEFGLGDLAESSVYEVSSGERQKLALAGVLAAQPQLVLADEPTTLLDLRSAAEFQRRLLALPVTLIVATHDLDFAARAERVIVFDDGAPVFDGDAAEGIAAYRRLALG